MHFPACPSARQVYSGCATEIPPTHRFEGPRLRKAAQFLAPTKSVQVDFGALAKKGVLDSVMSDSEEEKCAVQTEEREEGRKERKKERKKERERERKGNSQILSLPTEWERIAKGIGKSREERGLEMSDISCQKKMFSRVLSSLKKIRE